MKNSNECQLFHAARSKSGRVEAGRNTEGDNDTGRFQRPMTDVVKRKLE